MDEKTTLPLQCSKIMDRLFVFVDTKDIELNRSLNIVVNPEIIKILFKQVEEEPASVKIALLRQLSTIYNKNKFNSLILSKRDREIIEFNHSILESIIYFIFSVHPDPKEVLSISELFAPFVFLYPINCKIIKCILSVLMKDFYEEKITHNILKMALHLLKVALKHQDRAEDQPYNYFISYGDDGGMKMVSRNIKWPFSKGFHLYLKFYIEDLIKEQMSLFTLSSEQDDFLMFISSEGDLMIKVFSSSNILNICPLPKKQWITMHLHYHIKSKLLRNYYELVCVIDGDIHQRRDLPVPTISMTDQIQQMTLARNFYGRIHAFILTRSEIIPGNKLTMNTWKDVQSFLVINKKHLRDLFVLYVPILNTNLNSKEIIYDISSQNHAEMFENCGIHLDPFRQVNINYYGGLYTFLPFIHLLKFYEFEKYPDALTDIFDLYLIFFSHSFGEVQTEAINCAFLSIASQLINQINPKFIKPETVHIIKKLKSSITDMHLQKQMLVNFLFKLNIRKIEDVNVVNGLLEIIEDYFSQNFEWSYSLISIDDIFHYIIDNFEEEQPYKCCKFHYNHTQKQLNDQNQITSFSNNYLRKTLVMNRILKVIFKGLPSCTAFKPINTKIMELLFLNYSSCLQLLLLQTIAEGVKVDAFYYQQQFNILHYSYQYLERVQLPQKMATIIEILSYCQLYDQENWTLRLNNIHKIANVLDKVYTKKCQERRNRNSLQQHHFQNRRNARKHSSADSHQHVIEAINQKKTRKISAFKHRNEPIESNKHLYEILLHFCFEVNQKESEWLLKHDDYSLILQPYFRICCTQYRKEIIYMLRNTVVINCNNRKVSSLPNSFDKLYKLLLTEFVLKEIEQAEEVPVSDLTNDIIRNVYFIVDYTVINMRQNWIHLYVYLLRLAGIMEEVKKQIAAKTSRTLESITTAVKLANRKFVFRVVKLSEKNIQNISNLIFLVSLMVFGNITSNATINIFNYFKSFQRHLFIGVVPSNKHQETNKEVESIQPAFLDSKLILQTVNSFKPSEIEIHHNDPSQLTKVINAYLDLDYTTEHSELFMNRYLYLIKAEFKQLKNNESTIRQLFGKDEKKQISTGQLMSTMICVCVEAGLNTRNFQLFEEALQALLSFFNWFILLCTRDGIKKQRHQERNMQLPKTIASNVLHFLYTMMHSQYPENYIHGLENILYNIFVSLGLLIRTLSQKLGHPQNFQKGLQKSLLLKNVEQYNFFTFELLKEVLALKDLKNIPDISRDKVINLIHHPKLSGYFKNKLSFSIQSKIDEVISNHVKNVIDIRKEVEYYFQQVKHSDTSPKNELKIDELSFKKEFVVDHLRKNNLNYRKIQRIWIKIWKRIRLYHYFWSVSMNQRQEMNLPFDKSPHLAYRHKFSKFIDTNGVRPVLEVQHVQPWHVKKMMMQKEFEYRNSNYLYHLHEVEHKKRERSFLQKLIPMNTQAETIFYVDWIKHNSKRKGYLTVQNEKLKFKYLSTFQKDSHLEFTSFILAEYKPIEKYWPLVEIINIMERRYLTKRQCLLIEFQDGTSLIFNFLNEDKDEFINLIQARQNKLEKSAIMKLNKIVFYTRKFHINSRQTLDEATQLWKQHKMSNFKYLMIVNKYGGRSYLDPANYPVLPWIMSNFQKENSNNHRDLAKTVGALGNQQRIEFFINKLQATDPFDPVPPYQFGTHYSSPGVVFNFLLRLNPYTEASRTLQGGKFDLPDRLFSSIQTCWKSVTSQVSDVRELTPQFFYLPEFLLNVDQHDFGITQQKERVHNVHIPEWASSAYDFIVKHRMELESDYVSQNIGNWIDLVFGYKQKGKIAEENLNLFFYLTYEDAIDLKDITDQQTRISKQAQIMHFGQTPSQLWTKPHGGRPKAKKATFSLKKISYVFSFESTGPMTILGVKDNKLMVFHDYNVLYLFCHKENTYHLDREVRILRNNSKENIYFLEDIEFSKRVQIFSNNKYIAVASYINGDLLVFSLSDGKKVQEKKGTAKLCILINEREDLMIVGSRNGLLQVYQIVYGEKDSLTLIKIASEYYMASIHSISQGGGYFCIASGSLVTLIRANRSLNYVYDKFKMRGVKMIRSIQIPRKVEECIIATDPLFCIVVYTSLEFICYSGNGQHLASKQAELSFAPLKITQNYMDYLAYVQNNRLKILSLPFLKQVRDLQLPNKKFIEMRFYDNRCFLVTNYGQIITLSEEFEEGS